ncbi:MAG: hypothetical protein HYU63_09575 [Armatimonadetes bacterium]|nr:hypothetical protein [Armatimonadota bacterium]
MQIIKNNPLLIKKSRLNSPQEFNYNNFDRLLLKFLPKEFNKLRPSALPKVIILKEGGLKFLLQAINEAKKNIDIKIYIFTDSADKEISYALKQALDPGRKVNVRLMVEENPFYWKPEKPNPSFNIIKDLEAAGAHYKPANEPSKKRITHEKSIIIDGKIALILTGNLTRSAFSENLDLGAIIIRDQKTISQIQEIFDADWERREPNLSDSELVVSPENARKKINNLLDRATSSIHILQQGLTDSETLKKLSEKQKQGVPVEIILPNPGITQNNLYAAAYLASKKINIAYLDKPYLHAKAITINTQDNNPDDDTSFIGSQNFSYSGLQRNRELGIIFKDPGHGSGQSGQVEEIFKTCQKIAKNMTPQQICTESGAELGNIEKAFQLAERSILIQTNIFSSNNIIEALISASKRGIKVKAMFPENPFQEGDPSNDFNHKTAATLRNNGIEVNYTDAYFAKIAGTTILIDDEKYISTPDNLTWSAFNKNHNSGIINIDEKEVGALSNYLKEDWNKTSGNNSEEEINPPESLITPQNAREKIINLLTNASKYILLETPKLNDLEIINLLISKAQSGISVRVILADNQENQKDNFENIQNLIKAGVSVELYSANFLTNNFINADGEKIYLGGLNLSKTSLSKDHSFGLIINQSKPIEMAGLAFETDWLTACIDQVNNLAILEKNFIKFPEDQDLIKVLLDRAKYGVKINIFASNPDYASLDKNIEKLNKFLEKLAKLDPEKDLEKIALAYNLKYEKEKALLFHKKLIKALENLPVSEKLVNISFKDASQIKENYVEVDQRKIPLTDLPKADSPNPERE